MRKPIRTLISIAVAGIIANQTAQAGAFSLYTESSAAAIGNYAAGIAAEGADASIGWYNPAGLVLIHQQEVVLSGVGVFPSSKLSGVSTVTTKPYSFLPKSGPYVEPFSNLQGAESAFVPAVHYAKPLGERATFGFSIVAPFGLSTNWGNHSPVRYQATLTDLKTIDVSPELGGKLTDNLSIGAGMDFQWAQVKFNQVIGLPAILQYAHQHDSPLLPTAYDSLSFNKGYSFGLGFHAGVLGMFNDNHTRIGLNYQSRVNHQFHGHSVLTGPLGDTSLNIPLPRNTDSTFKSDALRSNDVALPDVTTLSLYQDINDHLAILGSVVYAGWDSFNKVTLYNVAAINDQLENALIDSTSIESYKNSWRFAAGANYRFNPQWMLRVGGGYDATPTVNAERDVRLPDANRWALSIGGHYQMSPALGFDLGYTYLWANEDSHINKTVVLSRDPSTNAPENWTNIKARANNHVHIVGLQAVWMIDHQEPMTTK